MKIKKMRIILLSGVLVLMSLNFALSQNTFKPMRDTVSFKKSLEATAQKTNTIKSDFVQEKNLSVLSEKIISKGQFYFKKSNLLRWEYTTPFQYIIALNGDNVMIKDGNKVSKYDVQSNKMFKEINDMMVGMVQGKLLGNKSFKLKYLEDDKYYIVQSIPLQKNKKEFLKEIYLFFDKKDIAVSKINFVEPSGDYTDITFTSRQMNLEIPNEKFVIK
jgi:outer membrane lipoprotein-sorting protein